MISSNNKISVKQLQSLFVLDIFGTGVIILPRTAAEFAQNDGWMLIIGALLFSLVYILLINAISSKYKSMPLSQYSMEILGKPLGFLLSFLLASRLILTAGLELRIFGEIVRQTMLFETPLQVTCAGMALISVYVVIKGYETRARLSEVLIYIVLVPLFFIFLTAAFDADFSNLLPIAKSPPRNILLGSFFTAFAFRGAELALLCYPLVNKPEKIRKGQISITVFIGAIMLFTTAITLAKFGANDVKTQLWPVIQMMDSTDFPLSFFERQDAFVLSFWIVSVFISISAGIFFSSMIFKDIFAAKSQNIYVFPCAIFVFTAALLPKNIVQTYEWQNVSDMTLGIAFLFFVPLFLLIVSGIKSFFKRGGKEVSDATE